MQTVESSSAAGEPDAGSAPPPVRPCRNCGAPAPGRYCPACGQATESPHLGVMEHARRALADFLGPRGRITLTLHKLLLAPGALTADYLAGRRARYLRPLQLYLAISVMVFAAVQLLDVDLVLRLWGRQGLALLLTKPQMVVQIRAHDEWMPVEVVVRNLHTPGVRRFAALSTEQRAIYLGERRARYVSSMLLVLVPAFAATLSLCWLGRRRLFSEHLVFAFHFQAFALLAVLAEALFLPALAADVLSAWTLAYFLISLRRVYTAGWLETLARGAAALAGYFALFYAANVVLVAWLLSM